MPQYLEELAITSTKDDLQGNIGGILNAIDAGRCKVDREAEETFTRDLEEGYSLGEVVEALRVAQCREPNSD